MYHVSHTAESRNAGEELVPVLIICAATIFCNSNNIIVILLQASVQCAMDLAVHLGLTWDWDNRSYYVMVPSVISPLLRGLSTLIKCVCVCVGGGGGGRSEKGAKY